MNQFHFSVLHIMDYEVKEVCTMSGGGCYEQGGYGGGGYGLGSGFALLVVLFILLIIVAAAFGYGGGGYAGGAC